MSRQKYSNVLINDSFEDIVTGLERNMVIKCPEKNNCISKFTALLKQNGELIKNIKVGEALISDNRIKLDKLKRRALIENANNVFPKFRVSS